MIPQKTLEQIAQDPKKYLLQCYRLDERIRIKNERISRLYQISTQITSTIKAVSAYTGPTDKIGNCVLEIASLQEELSEDINKLLAQQRETTLIIEELIPNHIQRSIIEARYIANMPWEQIAYEFHYAYRWTFRLHKYGLASMKAEAERRLKEWDDELPRT